MHDQGPSEESPKDTLQNTSFSSTFFPRPGESEPLQVPKGPFYFRYPRLSAEHALAHGVFTRWGGVSAPPYHSLNTSYAVGDRPDHVRENLARIHDTIDAQQLIFMKQTHGDNILALHAGHYQVDSCAVTADAVMTDIPGLGLVVKQADCQAVILFDPKKHVVANLHCGWRGLVQNIVGKAVRRLRTKFGCKQYDLLASIGPSLGPCCGEFMGHGDLFPKEFEQFMPRAHFFDFWALTRWQLINSGINDENIELGRICTRCRTDLFYSYRAEGLTGRFATVAMLKC
jgi:YfiH family protein